MSKQYCVAIRTLGTAGDKYQALLDSLKSQTCPPKHIFVYIPNGYATPKESIGTEIIIRCDKGMVTQRSLPFDEIDTDFVLLSDDDMWYPPTFAETILSHVEKEGVDCVVPDIYQNHTMGLVSKVVSAIYNSAMPRRDDGWALKIRNDVGYSYNANPQKSFLPTETGPGGCMFCRMNAYRDIHFVDERWLDSFSFASFDDQLFVYKLHLMNYNVHMYYNSGLKHLDAMAGVRPSVANKMFYKKKLLVVIWYRTIYNIQNKSKMMKCQCLISFVIRNIVGLFTLFGDIIRSRQLAYFMDYFKGLIAGYKYVHSDDYKKIPKYDAYIDDKK